LNNQYALLGHNYNQDDEAAALYGDEIAEGDEEDDEDDHQQVIDVDEIDPDMLA
jgi:hypothetical protein